MSFIPPSGRHDLTCEFLCTDPRSTCAHTCMVCDTKRAAQATAMEPPAWLLIVLEANSGRCLDTEEERLIVAKHIHAVLVGPEVVDDLSVNDLALRAAQGLMVSDTGHKEIAQRLVAITGVK